MDKKKLLGLSPKEGTANLYVSTSGGIDYETPLDTLRTSEALDGNSIGTEKLGDQQVEVYKVDFKDKSIKIWVDDESFPLRIESKSIDRTGKETLVVLENFRWNRPIN